MIERLVTVLRRAAVDVTPMEIAEALWLAPFLPPSPPPRIDSPTGSDRQPAAGPAPGVPAVGTRAPPQPLSLPVVAEPKAETPLTLPDRAGSAAGSSLRGGLEMKSPSALALPNALEISRSLRPLRRRVHDGRGAVIDERLTAERIADSGLWIPVLRPARSRWLDVALVVDLAGSMAIWQQAVRELTRLLERNGAFRDVRRWGLATDGGSAVLVQGSGRGDSYRERRVDELLDPAGRRLIAVFSDCTSPAWRAGTAQDLLRRWGRRGPVALIQPLPSSLWHRTGLGSGLGAAITSPVAAAANARLRWSTDSALDEGEQARAFPLPVMHLDQESIGGWARMVAGDPRSSASGIAWLPSATQADGASGAGDLTPERRVARFRSAASPQAQKLAGYLAAVPLTLPIMRLVWQSALPAARPVHLAEVFLSGLLREIATSASGDPESTRYDFHEGVREILLEDVPVSDSVEVLRRVSDYVEERLGQAFNFRAALRDPDEFDTTLDRPGEREFARVAAKVLRRLGGRYTSLADRLEGKAPPRPRKVKPAPAEEALAQRSGFILGGGAGFLIDERTFATHADQFGPRVFVGTEVTVDLGGNGHRRPGRVSRIDWDEGFALVQLQAAVDTLASIPVAEAVPSDGSWVFLGYDRNGILHALRGRISLDSSAPQLEYNGGRPARSIFGGGVLVNGKLLGLANGLWPVDVEITPAVRTTLEAVAAEEIQRLVDVFGKDASKLDVASPVWVAIRAAMFGETTPLRVLALRYKDRARELTPLIEALQRVDSRSAIMMTPLRWLERRRDSPLFKPNGWTVAVAGASETFGPVHRQLAVAVGSALADAGYRLRTLGSPGVDATVWSAYAWQLAKHGAAPEDLTVHRSHRSQVEQLLEMVQAVIGIGGVHWTGQILEAAQAGGIPAVPLAAAGGVAARVLAEIQRTGAPAWLDADVGLKADDHDFAVRVAAAAIRSLDQARSERWGRQVLVVGCGIPQEVNSCIREVSLAIGRQLAADGHHLLSGGWPGVDEIVGKAFVSAVVASGGDPAERFTQYLQAGMAVVLNAGRIERDAPDYRGALEAADALIVIGGHQFTSQLADRARRLGKPVLPIRRTGQAAATVFDEMFGEEAMPGSPTDRLLQALAGKPTETISPQSASFLAKEAGSLLARGFQHERDYGRALIGLILERASESEIEEAIESAISNALLGRWLAVATGRTGKLDPSVEAMRGVALAPSEGVPTLVDTEPRLLARDVPWLHDMGGSFAAVASTLVGMLASRSSGLAALARMAAQAKQPFSNPVVHGFVEEISRQMTVDGLESWLRKALGVSTFGYAFRHGFEAEVAKALAQTIRQPRNAPVTKKAPSGDAGSWKSVIDGVRRLPALKQLAALPPLLDHYYIAHDDPQLRATAYLVAAATDEATFRGNIPVFVERERERVNTDARQALATRLLLYCAVNLPLPDLNDAGRRSLRAAFRSLRTALRAAHGQPSADQELLVDAESLCDQNLSRFGGPPLIS